MQRQQAVGIVSGIEREQSPSSACFSNWRRVVFTLILHLLGHLFFCLSGVPPWWLERRRALYTVDVPTPRSPLPPPPPPGRLYVTKLPPPPIAPVRTTPKCSSPRRRTFDCSRSPQSPGFRVKGPLVIHRLSDAIKRQIAQECTALAQSCHSALDDYEKYQNEELTWTRREVELNVLRLSRNHQIGRSSFLGPSLLFLPPHSPTTPPFPIQAMNDPSDVETQRTRIRFILPPGHRDCDFQVALADPESSEATTPRVHHISPTSPTFTPALNAASSRSQTHRNQSENIKATTDEKLPERKLHCTGCNVWVKAEQSSNNRAPRLRRIPQLQSQIYPSPPSYEMGRFELDPSLINTIGIPLPYSSVPLDDYEYDQDDTSMIDLDAPTHQPPAPSARQWPAAGRSAMRPVSQFPAVSDEEIASIEEAINRRDEALRHPTQARPHIQLRYPDPNPDWEHLHPGRMVGWKYFSGERPAYIPREDVKPYDLGEDAKVPATVNICHSWWDYVEGPDEETEPEGTPPPPTNRELPSRKPATEIYGTPLRRAEPTILYGNDTKGKKRALEEDTEEERRVRLERIKRLRPLGNVYATPSTPPSTDEAGPSRVPTSLRVQRGGSAGARNTSRWRHRDIRHVSISPEPDAAAITPDLMPRIPAPAIVTSDEPSSNSTQPCTSSKATEDSNFFPQLPSLIIEESQIILPRYNRRRSSSRVPNGLPSPNPSDESAEEAVLLTTPPSIPRKRTPRVLVLATPEPTSDSSSEKAPVTRRRPRRSAPAVPSSSRVTRSRASIAAEAQREPSKARHPRVSAPPAAPVRRSARLAAAGRQASSVAEQPKKRSSTKRQRDEADTKGSNKKLRVC